MHNPKAHQSLNLNTHHLGRAPRFFLFLSGLLLLGIGGAILFMPQAFHAGNGIHLDSDPSLLSEIRAPGGLLTISAVLILLGAFRSILHSLALHLTLLVYGSFGLGRLVGIVIDGMPASGLVASTVIELVIAAIGLSILLRRPASASRSPRRDRLREVGNQALVDVRGESLQPIELRKPA